MSGNHVPDGIEVPRCFFCGKSHRYPRTGVHLLPCNAPSEQIFIHIVERITYVRQGNTDGEVGQEALGVGPNEAGDTPG
jgi:hypothetical protein